MVDGMSTREASRVFGLHRDTVRKMLAYSVPPGYRRRQPPRRPRIGPYTGVIDRILEDDPVSRTGQALGLPRKQRHTAKRIYDQLRDEYGFDGRYTIVKDYVREHRRRTREMFVPLVHPPGHAQCDFGEAWAVIGGVKRKVRSTSSSWTCPTAMPCSSGHTPPRPPRRSATDMCRRSRSWEGFPRASCTTTPDWPLPGYWETVVANAHECSLSYSRTTCSRTGSVVQAKATTRGRSRAWWGTPGGTSWCPYLRSIASRLSTPTSRSGALEDGGEAQGTHRDDRRAHGA